MYFKRSTLTGHVYTMYRLGNEYFKSRKDMLKGSYLANLPDRPISML